MPDRYYDKTNQPGNEVFLEPMPIAHLVYNPANPFHVALDDSNVFWSPIPAGQQLTYDIDGVPDGLEPIPALTATQQARADLFTAGVTIGAVTAALYADHRGNPALLADIDAEVDAVVISSGLTLNQVTELVE